MRRRRDRVQRAVDLGPVLVLHDGAAGVVERLRLGAGQIRADPLPRLPVIEGPPQVLRSGVQRVRGRRRHRDRVGPVPPLGHVARGLAHDDARPGLYVGDHAGRPVVAGERVGRPRIEDVGIGGVLRDVAHLASAHRVHPLRARAARVAEMSGLRRHARGGVVLLRAADVVGEVRSCREAIDLRRRIPHRGPGPASVHRDHAAPVVPVDHAQRVRRIDPEVVMVGVGFGHALQRFAAIGRAHEAEVEDVERVAVDRVRLQALEVEGALPDVAVAVDERPGPAPVVGPVQPSALGLEVRPHPVRVRAGHGDRDLAEHAGREARVARDLAPGVAAVGGLEDPRPLAAAPQAPRLAVHLPERRVQDVRIARVHDQVDRPGVFVAEEDLLPSSAPVAGPEDTALGVGPEGMAERRHVRAVGVGGMDADARDGVGVGEPEVPPTLPAVVRTVDAVALEDVGAQLHLAHADVDDVGVRRGHRDRAHRGAADLAIGHGGPGGSAVGGLEEPSPRRAEVVLERPVGVARHRDRASAPVRADRAPLHGGKEGDVVLCLEPRRHGGQRSRQQRCEQRGAKQEDSVHAASGSGDQPGWRKRALETQPQPSLEQLLQSHDEPNDHGRLH